MLAADPADGSVRTGFSAVGEINRVDFGVRSNEPHPALAGDKVRIDIEAGAVLRKQAGRDHG